MALINSSFRVLGHYRHDNYNFKMYKELLVKKKIAWLLLILVRCQVWIQFPVLPTNFYIEFTFA
jgi:hypothetical protein